MLVVHLQVSNGNITEELNISDVHTMSELAIRVDEEIVKLHPELSEEDLRQFTHDILWIEG